MTNSQSDIDELKALQREAAELRKERQKAHSTAESAGEQNEQQVAEPMGKEQVTSKPEIPVGKTPRKRSVSVAGSPVKKKSATVEEQEVANPSVEDAGDEALLPEADKAVRDLAVQIESVVKELEEAARERPALALLAAFTIGIVVGQLFSRR